MESSLVGMPRRPGGGGAARNDQYEKLAQLYWVTHWAGEGLKFMNGAMLLEPAGVRL
jgi:hypothetical protein